MTILLKQVNHGAVVHVSCLVHIYESTIRAKTQYWIQHNNWI